MHIAVPGYFPQQYSLEEIETNVKGVHASAQISIEDGTTEEDTLVPFTCTIELRNKDATAETIQQILSGLAGLESVIWKQDIGSDAILESVQNLEFVQEQLLQFGMHTRHGEQQTDRITRDAAQSNSRAYGFNDITQQIPHSLGKTNTLVTNPELRAQTKPLSKGLGQRIGDAIVGKDISVSGTPEKPVDEQ